MNIGHTTSSKRGIGGTGGELFAKLPGPDGKRPAAGAGAGGSWAKSRARRSGSAPLPDCRSCAVRARGNSGESPPFGGLATVSRPGPRILRFPGPIYELEGRQPDFAGFGRALFAAGLRRGDLLYNTFSYHFTPAGLMVDAGARAVGCAVFPAGTGQTELQAATIADLRPQGYAGTPSFLKILLDRGRETGADHSSLRKGLVSGEALPPSLRAYFLTSGASASCSATRRRTSASSPTNRRAGRG